MSGRVVEGRLSAAVSAGGVWRAWLMNGIMECLMVILERANAKASCKRPFES